MNQESTFKRLWKKFLITARHLIQRLLIRMRRLRKINIPRDIARGIKAIYQDCCRLWASSINNRALWDGGVQGIIIRHQSSYDKIFDSSPEDYPPESFVSVDAKIVNIDLIAANKQLEIAEKRELIGEKARRKISENAAVFYDPAYINFCKRLFTLELQVLTKYFTFGKTAIKDEVIELGEPIEARLLT